eukprot:278335-Chlamydomonas_euryale.AAC.1
MSAPWIWAPSLLPGRQSEGNLCRPPLFLAEQPSYCSACDPAPENRLQTLHDTFHTHSCPCATAHAERFQRSPTLPNAALLRRPPARPSRAAWKGARQPADTAHNVSASHTGRTRTTAAQGIACMQ